jgi:hypothetical protein
VSAKRMSVNKMSSEVSEEILAGETSLANLINNNFKNIQESIIDTRISGLSKHT